MSLNVQLEGGDELARAIRRNPEYVTQRALQMMTRLKAAYQQRIIRNPWRVGQSGGGVPVRTGALRDAHRYTVDPTKLTIGVRSNIADSYGMEVHSKRPWLDYAQEKEKDTRERQYDDFLKDVVGNLAK